MINPPLDKYKKKRYGRQSEKWTKDGRIDGRYWQKWTTAYRLEGIWISSREYLPVFVYKHINRRDSVDDLRVGGG